MFIRMAKEGSTISGLMDTIATLTSVSLQYGVPLEALVSKFSHVRFEPSGFTRNPDIPFAKSLTDYIFRFLGTRFLSTEQKQDAGLAATEPDSLQTDTHTPAPVAAVAHIEETPPTAIDARMLQTLTDSSYTRPTWQAQADAPSCADCGSIMIRNGSCYKCLDCGSTSGCS